MLSLDTTLPDKASRSSVTLSGGGSPAITLGFDNLYLVNYPKGGKSTCPYSIKSILDQDFEIVPDLDGWQTADYDDRLWGTATLPKVHGGERYAGEDLYLRQTLKVGAFERVELNIEEICPGGEIRINGKPAMLNGTQTMGFRTPLEIVARYARCAPAPILAGNVGGSSFCAAAAPSRQLLGTQGNPLREQCGRVETARHVFCSGDG